MGAAEASNNSATISSTVPFLMLGLPITASELYLDNWLSMFRNTQVNWQIFYQQIDLGLTAVPFYYYFIGCVLLVNMMAFYLSSRLTVLYQSLASLPARFMTSVIKGSITVTLIGMIWTNGISASSLVTILLPASCLGVWARSRQIDVVALPISLVVGKLTFDTFAKAYYLYF
jgi:TctA family transporter